jgi:hypothetical protein
MQMKIGRWQGLYPRIQSAAKHIRCGFVCGYRKTVAPFRSERSAIIGALNRVYTVLTQGRTGPPRKSKSNKSIAPLSQAAPESIRIAIFVTCITLGPEAPSYT